MHTKRTVRNVIMLIILMVLSMSGSTVQAADRYIHNYGIDSTKSIDGVEFVAKQYEENGTYKYKILMKKNGKTQVLLKDVECDYVTNGKIIYYIKHTVALGDWKYKNTIYRYNIQTKKKERVISGIDYTVRACNGRYLYYGRDKGADGVELYVLDMKTGKKKHIMDVAGSVYIVGNRAIVSICTGDADNDPIYSFSLKGTDKKTIAMGSLLKTKGMKVYYCKTDMRGGLSKIYSCNALGGNKKALTGWIKRIPEKYWN